MRPTQLLPTTSAARPAPIATAPSYLSPPYPESPPLNFSDLVRTEQGRGDNSIYTVAHRFTGAHYSVKVIRYNQDDLLRREILREIEICRGLNHPNVVKCHRVFDHAGEFQVLIEYMDGRSLEGTQVPDEPSLADLAFQILSGLSYLHHRKIAHGDIKPSNLLIGSVGLVKIAYFGLSRISTSTVKPYDSSTKAIAYTSPERINTDLSQGVYDGCAGDIWGIGLIILEVYLGIYPKTPEAPPTASWEFRDFIACCLETDPAKRWTAQQLLQHPFILLNTDICCNDNIDGNAADKMLSRNLKEIESKSDPFSRTRKPRKWCGTTTKIYDVNPNEFRQMLMELTGMGRHTMETPHQTVGAVTEAEAEGEAETETETEEQLVVQQTVEPSLPSVEVPDQALWDMDRQFKSCILYCSLFPVGYKFEKDSLVQMWIAEGLIKAVGNERMEDVGGLCFDYLSKREYVVSSGFDHFGNRETYRVGEAMASILEIESLAPLYCRVENSHFADLSILSMHLSLVCNYIDQNTFEAIKRCRNLRTLLLLGHYGSSVKQVPYDLFLGLELLRVLNLSCTHLSQLPNSIGNLKSLRYIDVSETRIKRLPESVDCLQNLQTLRLRDCLDLVGLPKNISKLVNLRHLDLDIARQLKSMPTGMGNLTNLQTLRTFLVGREDGCRIGELKNMNNISGSLCIWRLENVLNKEEAKVAALSNKLYLNKLELRWGDLRDGKAEDEEEIIECLQPHSGLKELHILFYRGSMLPSWISSPSFVNIASITLYKCTSCHLLPSIGELPSLKSLTVVEMNMVRNINRLFCRDRASQGYHAFPKLEKLTFDVMFNLEEWTGVENGDFPLLLHLTIKYCPKLISLPLLSLLISLKYFEISHCPELSSFPEEGLPASLGFLMVRNCPALKERCQKGEGEDWFKIAHVPSIWIDHQEIFLD